MKPAKAKIIKALRVIAREDGWSKQRTKSMLGILKNAPDHKCPEILKAVIERRPS